VDDFGTVFVQALARDGATDAFIEPSRRHVRGQHGDVEPGSLDLTAVIADRAKQLSPNA
jgi:hypothetical protein